MTPEEENDQLSPFPEEELKYTKWVLSRRGESPFLSLVPAMPDCD
jgi:hypothetical protein